MSSCELGLTFLFQSCLLQFFKTAEFFFALDLDLRGKEEMTGKKKLAHTGDTKSLNTRELRSRSTFCKKKIGASDNCRQQWTFVSEVLRDAPCGGASLVSA